MKKAFGIMVAAVIALVAAFSFAGCGETSLQQSDLAPLRKAITELAKKVDSLTAENGELSDKISDLTADINDLTTENGELSDRVDSLTTENGELSDKISDLIADINDLTTENGELSDRIESLNVFWTDKAEYGERETMTVYFGNRPVLKIRIDFDNLRGTALFGEWALNNSLYITSLCADIYADSIVGTSFVDSDNGTFVRDPSSSVRILTQNKETSITGSFDATKEAYAGATWFDIVICVPGTPFELARFKNVSVYKPE